MWHQRLWPERQTWINRIDNNGTQHSQFSQCFKPSAFAHALFLRAKGYVVGRQVSCSIFFPFHIFRMWRAMVELLTPILRAPIGDTKHPLPRHDFTIGSMPISLLNLGLSHWLALAKGMLADVTKAEAWGVFVYLDVPSCDLGITVRNAWSG